VATTQGAPFTLALVVAAPLRWGVFAAKPPYVVRLQLSGISPMLWLLMAMRFR